MAIESLVWALLLFLCSSFLAWKGGFYTLPKQETSHLPAVSFLECALFFACFFLSFLLAAILIEIFFLLLASVWRDALPSAELGAWRMPLISFLALCCFLFISFKCDAQLLRRLVAMDRRAFAFGCLSFGVCVPVLLFLSAAISPLMEWFDVPFVDQNVIQALKSTSLYPIPFFFNALAVVFVAPFMEEVLFRGVLFGFLRARWGRFVAIITTSVWFALFHYSPTHGWRNLEIFSYLFVLSCYLGFIYERQRSLWAPIGLHACANLVNVALISAYK